jgi:hypothetical protein
VHDSTPARSYPQYPKGWKSPQHARSPGAPFCTEWHEIAWSRTGHAKPDAKRRPPCHRATIGGGRTDGRSGPTTPEPPFGSGGHQSRRFVRCPREVGSRRRKQRYLLHEKAHRKRSRTQAIHPLHNAGERLREGERNGESIVEAVAIKVHLRQAEYVGAGWLPAAVPSPTA